MQQKLANYDPYSIQEVQFFVQKKTKYTTLKSILVSLVILALTIVLNISSVEQLWIGRAQLSVTSTDMKMSNEQFTSSYVCLIAKNSSQLPNSTLYTFSASLNKIIMSFQPTSNFDFNQQIMNMTQSREFKCYDISGAVINEDISMTFIIQGITDQFDFMFQVFTADQIMGKAIGNNYIYYQNIPNSKYFNYFYTFKKIRGIIYDSLLINYQPQIIQGFSETRTFLWGDSNQTYSSITFTSQTAKPFDTTSSYTIIRNNIGDILGKLLSWFSIFVLIAAFGISPILQYNYQVELCKKLYDNPKLTQIEISIISYFKYVISWFKKGVFDESILYAAFKQLEKDLDLMNLIKKQTMMKKLIKQNQFVSKESDHIQGTAIIENDDEKQNEELFIGKFLNNQLLSQTQNHQQFKSNLLHSQSNHQEKTEAPLVTQLDPKSEQSFIVSIFKFLDASEAGISLISNKGQGYKTSWNTILTLICSAAVLWFIVFAGIFQIQPSFNITSVALDYNDTIIPNITINPEDILFRANKSDPTDDFNLVVFIINQNDQVLQTLTLLQGTDCDQYVQNLNQTSSDWQCLQKPINIFNSGKANKTKLALMIQYNGFSFSTNYIQTLFWQYNIIDEQLNKSKIYNIFPYSSNQVYKIDGQAIIYINSNQRQSIPDNVDATEILNPNLLFWTCNKYTLTTEAIFKGVTYEIQPQLIKITQQQPTIWDIINTAWGIVVLAFSVFLSKITRYLNVKEREKITKGQENQSRNDIVTIVSTQYKLVYNVFAKELQQVKYFYKTNLRDFGFKSR